MKWTKYVEYALLVVSLLSVVVMFFLPRIMFNGAPEFDIEWMLIWAYILVALGVLAMLVGPLLNIIKNPKSLFKTLIGLVVAAVLIGGCYLLSSDAPVANPGGGFFEDVVELKFTDTVLYLAYFGLGAAAITILFTEIRKALQ